LTGNGSTAASSTRNSSPKIRLNNATDIINNRWYNAQYVNINNYSNSTTYKTALYRIMLASDATDAGVGLWRALLLLTSSCINTSIRSNLGTGCTATLYGIKAE
jgi:hypothetical protein